MSRLTTLKPRVRPAPTRHPAPAPTGQHERVRGSAWQTTRARILTRDMGVCRCAGCRAAGRLRPASEVDHVVPLWENGTNDDSNLQAINVDCHVEKTASEYARRLGKK